MSVQVEEFDLLVVGGGKAGKTLAMDRARGGLRVVMVERGMIGGTCINVACIPTKSLVASARALRSLARGRDLGLIVGEARADVDLLRAHKEEGDGRWMASAEPTSSSLNPGMDLGYR